MILHTSLQLLRQNINHCNPQNKRHPIFHPNGWAMWVFYDNFGKEKKWPRYNGTALHISLCFSHAVAHEVLPACIAVQQNQFSERSRPKRRTNNAPPSELFCLPPDNDPVMTGVKMPQMLAGGFNFYGAKVNLLSVTCQFCTSLFTKHAFL